MDERFDGVLEPARSKGDVSARAEGAASDASLRAERADEAAMGPGLEKRPKTVLSVISHLLF